MCFAGGAPPKAEDAPPPPTCTSHDSSSSTSARLPPATAQAYVSVVTAGEHLRDITATASEVRQCQGIACLLVPSEAKTLVYTCSLPWLACALDLAPAFATVLGLVLCCGKRACNYEP